MIETPDIEAKARTKCEIWSRVMGYMRPVTAWNIGKQAEFKERQYFKEPGYETNQQTNDS